MEINKRYESEIDTNTLRAHRNNFNLRQTDMAAIMGFEVIDRICHWERGRAIPNLINAIRLSILFQADLKDLYPELYARIQSEIQTNVKAHHNT